MVVCQLRSFVGGNQAGSNGHTEIPAREYRFAGERVLRMKFRPIGERALVKVEAREEKTPSGIVLPETAKDKPQTARIIAVGDIENGGVGEGDLVVFST